MTAVNVFMAMAYQWQHRSADALEDVLHADRRDFGVKPDAWFYLPGVSYPGGVLEPLGKPTDSEEQGRPNLQVLNKAPTIDLRILQANERTLLAWIRTGLALMGFGFVVARMGMWLREVQPTSAHGPWSGRLGAAFVLLGTISNALAAVRYVRVRKAIIEGREMIPGDVTILTLAYGLVVLGGILSAYIVAR